jgi:hypothetical protein
MEKPYPQTFENHQRFPMSLTVNGAGLLVAVLLSLAGLLLGGAVGMMLIGLAVLITALFGISLAWMARAYALTLQDRIIRLEMQVRLAQILPLDLAGRAKELTLPQLIALRFASDEELPALIEKVLDEKIQDRKTIKRMIRRWQADCHRV